MESGKKIFCVIPAYNEAATIKDVVKNVKQIVNDVVVVDDGSRDGTSRLAKASGAIVLRHAINRGQGAALQTGTDYAFLRGADVVVHFDADGQFIPEEINKMIGSILTGEADIVLGSRFLGIKSNLPWLKEKVIFPLARFFSRNILRLNLTDPQNGFRAMNRSAGERIKIENDGMAHCSEILVKIKRSNLRYKEVPITVIYREFGLSLFGGFKILKDLFLGLLIN